VAVVRVLRQRAAASANITMQFNTTGLELARRLENFRFFERPARALGAADALVAAGVPARDGARAQDRAAARVGFVVHSVDAQIRRAGLYMLFRVPRRQEAQSLK